ncbi:hypothetical protein QBC32DRAFT_355565 [Pseudoneurospora amorphoporcata]|uniref:Uncharacterized protein n=1 Tax=Pseudoneurospora amorphoporcata TaxID=241081 RepID=A0AAN6NJP5_9PEZI|nr:hypothetical protein QBC32DRAFT_355565 [Pseudoneurospora amorphoporcata]
MISTLPFWSPATISTYTSGYPKLNFPTPKPIMDQVQPEANPEPRALTPIESAEPNNLQYTDDEGVARSIYLPQGTMHTAWDHLENERWDELAKYEPYTDQGYTKEDFKKARELRERRLAEKSDVVE